MRRDDRPAHRRNHLADDATTTSRSTSTPCARPPSSSSRGLTDAFGFDDDGRGRRRGQRDRGRASTAPSLGLLIGPGGRTLLAIQDLARVAAQRRLGDHDTRLRIDVAGYREKRREALERFAAHRGRAGARSGVARSLDPMPSADRKVIHDALAEIDGVDEPVRGRGSQPPRGRRPRLSP